MSSLRRRRPRHASNPSRRGRLFVPRPWPSRWVRWGSLAHCCGRLPPGQCARAPGLNGCMSVFLMFDFFLIFTNVTRLWTVDPGGHVMLKFQEPLDVSFVNRERSPEIYFFTSRAVSHIERYSPSHDTPPFSIYFSFDHTPQRGEVFFSQFSDAKSGYHPQMMVVLGKIGRPSCRFWSWVDSSLLFGFFGAYYSIEYHAIPDREDIVFWTYPECFPHENCTTFAT